MKQALSKAGWHDAWERLLFASANPQAVAAFRLMLALALLLAFTPQSDLGADIRQHPRLVELYEQVFLTRWYWWGRLVPLGLLALGWWPRAMGVLLLGLLFPLDFLSGYRESRQVLLMALLAFCFVRSDAMWSVRSLRRPDVLADAGPIWPIRLIQIQLSLVYGVNALAKLTPQYLSGDVLQGFSKVLPNFVADVSYGTLHLGPLAIPVWLGAVASVAIELALAIGLWFPRLRWATAALGVTFHVGLKWIIRIGLLDYASMFLYLAFLLPFVPRPAQAATAPQHPEACTKV
jgi:hypothetical protein